MAATFLDRIIGYLREDRAKGDDMDAEFFPNRAAAGEIDGDWPEVEDDLTPEERRAEDERQQIRRIGIKTTLPPTSRASDKVKSNQDKQKKSKRGK